MVAGGTNSSGTGDKGVDELRARCERCLGQLGELTRIHLTIRFGFDPSFSTGFVPMLFSLPAMVFGLVFAWPGGIPLTRALERLHPVSRPATYACAAVLCPLSVGAATIGGLFGPPGIWIYAGIVSLPAWLVLWLLRWRASRLELL